MILALAVLALRLKIQSKILLIDSDASKQRLAKQTIKMTLVTLMPVSIGMVVAGFLIRAAHDSFISVGFTLMSVTLMLLIQGHSLNYVGEEAKSFGRKVDKYSWVFFYTDIAAIVAIITWLLLTR